MTLSGTSILYIVELVCYTLILPCTLYLAYRHGKHAILGYFYLHACCAIRIASDAVNLADSSSTNNDHSIGANVLSAVGLSPLLLTLLGFLHEAHYYFLQETIYSEVRRKQVNRWLWHIQIHLHTIRIVGVIPLIIGGVKLAEATTASDVNTAESLRKAGSVILLVLWVIIVHYGIFLIYQCHLQREKVHARLRGMNKWTLLAIAFAGVRVIYVVVYAFDPTDSTINPVTGSAGVKAGLVVLPALLAAMSLTTGGKRSLVVIEMAKRPYVRSGGNYSGVAYHNPHDVPSVEYARPKERN